MPATSPHSWNARIVEDGDDFARNIFRLVIFKTVADDRVQLVGPDAVIATVDAGAHVDRPGITIPADAMEAIRDAVDERLGRRYDEALVDQLRDALLIEQGRTDRVIDALLPKRED